VSKQSPAKPEQTAGEKKRLVKIMALLGPLYPDHRPLLNYGSPFQLLVATVLAAQCTDAAVNLVTAELFRLYPNPAALAGAPLADLERIVHSTGFFRAKARNIKALSRLLEDRHKGEVPRTMEELTALPGTGRKTASVVLSTCFGLPAIIVDTHFSRVCRRLGFSSAGRPEQIERDMAALAPEGEWTALSHVFNRFGRDTCHARKPACGECPAARLCPAPEFI
jgi:endonuclease-3